MLLCRCIAVCYAIRCWFGLVCLCQQVHRSNKHLTSLVREASSSVFKQNCVNLFCSGQKTTKLQLLHTNSSSLVKAGSSILSIEGIDSHHAKKLGRTNSGRSRYPCGRSRALAAPPHALRPRVSGGANLGPTGCAF